MTSTIKKIHEIVPVTFKSSSYTFVSSSHTFILDCEQGNSGAQWGAVITQWIHLRLPSCLTWVRVPSTPSTILSFIVKFVCLCIVKRTKYKLKEAGFGPFI